MLSVKAFVQIKADLYKISLPRSSEMQNSVPIVYEKKDQTLIMTS